MEVYWCDRLRMPNKEDFNKFLNAMSKRIAQGHARYGSPDKQGLYIKRLRLELNSYLKTGNAEHLYNIANYAWLESVAPSNSKFHKDATVKSATRGKV